MVQRTIGPYRIDDRLGAGGMGEVFRAWDERLDRSVAIKLVHSQTGDDPQRYQRFLLEAKATARFSHPSIVQVFDILEHEDQVAIVMEWIDGQTLAQMMAQRRLSLAEAVAWGRDIASGLAEAHQHGIIHRDLKSDNVMVTRAGRVKVLDFGLAKPVGLDLGEVRLSTTGEIRGTAHAMSPEQAQGFAVDPRSDLFSLGILLYEMVTGQRPFTGDSALAILGQVISYRQVSTNELDERLPRELSSLIDHLLEKDPSHRPPSALAVEEALVRIAGTLPALTAAPQSLPRAAAGIDAALPDTLTRVPRPAPLATDASHDPAVDAADKEGVGKNRRSPWLVALVMASLALSVLTAAWIRRATAPDLAAADSGVEQAAAPTAAPLRVAILDPTIDSSADVAASPELVAFAIRRALARGLQAMKDISPLPMADTDAVTVEWSATAPRGGAASLGIARALAADELLSTHLLCTDVRCSVAVSRISGASGAATRSRDFPVPIDELSQLSTLVSQNLRHLYPQHQLADGSDLQVSAADYEEYVRVRWSYHRSPQAGETSKQLLRRLEAVLARSPRFLDAQLLTAEMLRQRYDMSGDTADLERTFAALERARQLAPEDPRAWQEMFNLSYRARRWRLAEEAVEELERLMPGDPSVLMKRAWWALEQGEPGEALALATQATRLRPSWRLHNNLATLLYKAGDLRAAQAAVHTALELFPDNLKSLSLAAEIASVSGDREALELYQRLVDKRPDAVREWWNFGITQMLFGKLDAARKCFEKVRQLAPGAWRVLVAQGDVAYLEERDDMARFYYRQALNSGIAAGDSASSGWTQMTLARANAGLGNHVEAAAALRESLKLLGKSAEQPFLAYQAAAVYALLDDRTSALASTREALDRGMSSRWFHLRWFDHLRDLESFQELLARAETALDQPSGPRSS